MRERLTEVQLAELERQLAESERGTILQIRSHAENTPAQDRLRFMAESYIRRLLEDVRWYRMYVR
jgi:hypothetical protein